jgi:Cu+-exporting ATPase
MLSLTASAERYSEHPLAEAVRNAAKAQSLTLSDIEQFEAVPGIGVRARICDALITVGSNRITDNGNLPLQAQQLAEQGRTLLYVAKDGKLIGVLGAMDTIRPEVPQALKELRTLGVKYIEL